MPQLKTATKTVRTVDYADLEAFIKEVTGQDWSFVAAEECSNGTDYSITVTKDPLSPYDQATMDKFLTGHSDNPATPIGGPWAQLMLDWLAVNGHIETGNYLVQVTW